MSKEGETAGEAYVRALGDLVNQGGAGGAPSAEQVMGFYKTEASKYDSTLAELAWISPERTAAKLADLVPEGAERKSCRVIDIAAGTGLAGEELKKRGFQNLEALDPSPEMLEVLKSKKGLYNEVHPRMFGDGSFAAENKGKYDAVVISGGFFGEGHLPVGTIGEAAELLRPGGFFVNVMAKVRTEEIVSAMKKAEAEGKWSSLADEVIPEYRVGKEGILHAYKRL